MKKVHNIVSLTCSDLKSNYVFKVRVGAGGGGGRVVRGCVRRLGGLGSSNVLKFFHVN